MVMVKVHVLPRLYKRSLRTLDQHTLPSRSFYYEASHTSLQSPQSLTHLSTVAMSDPSKQVVLCTSGTSSQAPSSLSLNTDILLLIADILTSERDRHTLLSLVQTCRSMYDLCSHLLLGRLIRIALGIDDDILQSFCEFLLANSRARLRHLESLILSIASLDEEASHSELSVKLLTEVLENATSLGCLKLPLGFQQADIPSLFPLINKLPALQCLHFKEYATPMTKNLLENLQMPLVQLTIQVRGLFEEETVLNPIALFKNVALTLRHLDLMSYDGVELSWPGLEEVVVYPDMQCLQIHAQATSISMDTLTTAYPNLCQFRIGNVRVPDGEEPEAFFEQLHSTSERALQSKKWTQMEYLSATGSVLHGLAVMQQMPSLCVQILHTHDADEDKLTAICSAVRPSELHLYLTLDICPLSTVSAILRASGATMVRIFVHADHNEDGDDDQAAALAATERNVTDFFELFPTCLKDTSIIVLSLRFTYKPLLRATRAQMGTLSDVPPQDRISTWLREYSTRPLIRELADNVNTLQHIFVEIAQTPRSMTYGQQVVTDEGKVLQDVPGNLVQILTEKINFFSRMCCLCCQCTHSL